MSNFNGKKYSLIVVSLMIGFILFSSLQMSVSRDVNAVFEVIHFPPDSIIGTTDSTNEINTEAINTADLDASAALVRTTGITGRIVAGDLIAINYERLLTVQPNVNWVALWQGSQIHYNEEPLRKMSITNLQQGGSFNFDSLSLSSLKYIVGFGLGDSISGATSTLFFAKGETVGIPFATSITLREQSANSLVYDFETPLGNLPSDNGNWVGVWKGKTIDINSSNLLKRAPVNKNVCSGTGSINGLNLEIQTWYTVTYATGPSDTDICASYTFQAN
jgi:hypothetical protein